MIDAMTIPNTNDDKFEELIKCNDSITTPTQLCLLLNYCKEQYTIDNCSKIRDILETGNLTEQYKEILTNATITKPYDDSLLEQAKHIFDYIDTLPQDYELEFKQKYMKYKNKYLMLKHKLLYHFNTR